MDLCIICYSDGHCLRHWILLIVRAKRETVLFLDPLPGNRVPEQAVNSNLENSVSTPKQPSSVECGYYVMRFMRDIIMDPSLAFEKKYARENRKRHTPKKQLMKSGMNGQSLFANHMELLNT
ncbi:hypothetical protein Prudu_006514 [Prunus dulcis]|uniref:Ubiquitin-like protease family profile domain-containing protein n=1 Tax=Prunus dulcis TaxID=3755 RepID=A0A4Y1QZZ0_PRUDU|nr:hypothetical protein Prudu_006514 [Prunus dulcis]